MLVNGTWVLTDGWHWDSECDVADHDGTRGKRVQG